MTVLILHGISGHAGKHWMQWLHDELVKLNHQVIMPDLPEPDRPDRKTWFNLIKDLLQDIEPSDLVIVGHSLGVASALDYIEQADGEVKALISVAGFYQDYKAELNSYYMAKRDIDIAKARGKIGKSFVFYGDNDPYVPQKILANLAKALGVEPVIIGNGGHLNTDAGYTKFPQLLEALETL